MDDVPSVTQTYKQVNQKHKQNHVENTNKPKYIHRQKKKLNKIIAQKINHLQYRKKNNHYLTIR